MWLVMTGICLTKEGLKGVKDEKCCHPAIANDSVPASTLIRR